MSLIADAIKLSLPEKELHNLNYPFKTIPTMKIAKLAVSQAFQQKYRGIGSFMVQAAHRIARACNDEYFSARFITVDADIEHDEGVLSFYQKTSFILNSELYNKNRKTISMRLLIRASPGGSFSEIHRSAKQSRLTNPHTAPIPLCPMRAY
jgi:hypothetical protein